MGASPGRKMSYAFAAKNKCLQIHIIFEIEELVKSHLVTHPLINIHQKLQQH